MIRTPNQFCVISKFAGNSWEAVISNFSILVDVLRGQECQKTDKETASGRILPLNKYILSP